MGNSNSAINPSAAVILKAEAGYAHDDAELLQTGYEQLLSYSRMYNMDLQKVLQARLFVNGNYAALLILGAQGDWEASDEAVSYTHLDVYKRQVSRATPAQPPSASWAITRKFWVSSGSTILQSASGGRPDRRRAFMRAPGAVCVYQAAGTTRQRGRPPRLTKPPDA